MLYINIISNNNKFCIKSSFHLVNLTKKLNNFRNIKTFYFKKLFKNTNINDNLKVMTILCLKLLKIYHFASQQIIHSYEFYLSSKYLSYENKKGGTSLEITSAYILV